MDDIKCQNCGNLIKKAGLNYRGEDRWVHVSTDNMSCDLFATPSKRI